MSSQVVRRFIRDHIKRHAALVDQEALDGDADEH